MAHYIIIQSGDLNDSVDKIRQYLVKNPDTKLEQSYIKYLNSHVTKQSQLLLDFDKKVSDEFRVLFPDYKYIIWGSDLIQAIANSLKLDWSRDIFHEVCHKLIQPKDIKTFELLECVMVYYDAVAAGGGDFDEMYNLMKSNKLDIVLLKSLFGDMIKL